MLTDPQRPSRSIEDQPPDLTAALASARTPLKPLRWPSVDLRVRLRTTPWVQQLMPARLAVRRAIRNGQRGWERYPEDRAGFCAGLEAIVGATERAGEVEQLARAYLVESEVQRVLFWRRWEAANMDAATAAHLREACESGRGVLLSFCHMGPFFHSASIGPSLGRTVYTVGGPWCFEEPAADYWGRRQVRRMEGVRKWDGRMVLAKGAFPVLQALLEDGEVVLMHFDVPGHHETRFLGKPVMLTAGSARLALRSDAVVVPLRFRRAGHRVWVDAHPQLDPREHSEVEQLHKALAAVHERWILELPATLEDPRRGGFWARASAAGWPLPD